MKHCNCGQLMRIRTSKRLKSGEYMTHYECTNCGHKSQGLRNASEVRTRKSCKLQLTTTTNPQHPVTVQSGD